MNLAIEGPSYAGKTSLAATLVSARKVLCVIPEYNEIAGGAKNFPPTPRNRQEAISACHFFLELERKRQRLILCALKGGQVALQDRSLFTCIALDYASAAYGEQDIWAESERLFLEKGRILPDLVFYLDVSQAEIAERKSRDIFKIPEKLVDPKFNASFRDYFVYRSVHHTQIVMINADQPAAAVSEQVLLAIDALIRP